MGDVGFFKSQVFCVAGQEEGNVCPICNKEKEERKHICVHCGQIYRVWVRVAKL